MPVIYPPSDGPPRIVLSGRCVPEEAEDLLAWLRANPAGEADLGGCIEPHAALLQLLLAARARIAVPPADPILASCLGAASAGQAPATPPINNAAPDADGTGPQTDE